jgi:hypothetical protein
MEEIRQKGVEQWQKVHEVVVSWRGSRKLIVFIVAVALLLDNMLLTSVGKKTFDHDLIKHN